MLIRNVRTYELEIAATGDRVPPGATVEVADDDLVAGLLAQPDNWEPAAGPLEVDDTGEVERPHVSATKAEWVAYAVTQGVAEDDANASTKADLIEMFTADTGTEDGGDAEEA